MDSLLRHWGLQGYDVRPLTEGTNNAGYYVGDEFVLRIHRNAITPTYEHAVLRALSGLSFAVPVPVPIDGETAVHGELNGETVLASLSHRIPGEHPKRGDAPSAEACGRALAELDHALGHPSEAFQRGYLGAFPLTGAELSALREFELMREATSFVHWYGRYVDGQITAANLADRVERLRRVKDWASER